jgi:hypothetical protein
MVFRVLKTYFVADSGSASGDFLLLVRVSGTGFILTPMS